MNRLNSILAGLFCLTASLVGLPDAHAQISTVEYIHTDAVGTVIERSEYEPYGQLVNRPLTDGPGFTGHVQDAATGLTYMQQRYYDPVIGRFLSVDPVTAYSSPGGNFNRYWYANNSPYKFRDLDGRQSSLAYIDAYLRHYYRNALNEPAESKAAAQAAGNWEQMSESESVFHQQGVDGEKNTKWIDESGHHEAVYDGNGGLVTDRLNGGTYNYVPPSERWGHIKYDILPYLLWGNGPIVVSSQSVMGSIPVPVVTVGPIEQVTEPSQKKSPPPPPPQEPQPENREIK